MQIIDLLGQLGTGDRMAIYVLYQSLAIEQDYTSNRELLLRSVTGHLPPPLKSRLLISRGDESGRDSLFRTPPRRGYDGRISCHFQSSLDSVWTIERDLGLRRILLGPLMNGTQNNISTMQQFAEATGGRAYYCNDLNNAVREAV
jgi:hypothetical protein